MSKLPDTARVSLRAGSVWKNCAGCGLLFPAAPGTVRCPDCEASAHASGSMISACVPAARCAAAHGDDRSRCDGPVDAVRVVDRAGAEVAGCVRHASVLLASVAGARVYPGSVAGAAVEVFHRAQSRRPFTFDPVEGGGR